MYTPRRRQTSKNAGAPDGMSSPLVEGHTITLCSVTCNVGLETNRRRAGWAEFASKGFRLVHPAASGPDGSHGSVPKSDNNVIPPTSRMRSAEGAGGAR